METTEFGRIEGPEKNRENTWLKKPIDMIPPDAAK
jgi:hypothetical protein